MKIQGTTINTPIARTAVVADSVVSGKPWSSKNTVDKLCPTFTESGSVVTCEPVEGYPLGVTSHIEPVQEGSGNPYPPGGGKNKFSTTLEYGTWNFISKTKNVDTAYARTAELIAVTPGTTYVFSGTASQIWLGNMAFYDQDGAYLGDDRQIFAFDSFTVPEDAYYIAFHIRVSHLSYVVDPNGTVQMEVGTNATDYAPYSNIRPISGHTAVKLTRCGKNLFGCEAFANRMVELGATKDATAGTVTYSPGSCNLDDPIFDTFKENTQYTIILYGRNTIADRKNYMNLNILYTDGSYENISGVEYNVDETIVRVTSAGRTVQALKILYSSGNTLLHYDQCGIFEGVIETDGFEPYNGDTFTLDLGQTVYGGSLDWNSGVLTITYSSVVFDGVSVGKKMDGADPQSARLDYAYTPNLNGRLQKLNGKVYTDRAYGYIINNTKVFLLSLPKNITGVTNEDDASTTIEKFNAVLESWYNAGTPLMAVFEMETPITIQLTAQEILALSGVNTLYSDTGDTEVTGRADPGAIINKLCDKVDALTATITALTGV